MYLHPKGGSRWKGIPANGQRTGQLTKAVRMLNLVFFPFLNLSFEEFAILVSPCLREEDTWNKLLANVHYETKKL